MAISPATISNGATGSATRAKLNDLLTASSRAESMGFSQTDHAANRTALDALCNVGGGGTAVLGPYDYDWRWVTTFTRPTHEPITLIGVPGKTRILLDHATMTASGLFDLRDSSIILYGIEFVATGSLGALGKSLIYASRASLTADIDLIHVEKCKVSGLETVVNTTAGSAESTYKIKQLIFEDNVVNCRSGAVRISDVPCSNARVERNRIDGATDGVGGCIGGFGGIFLNFINNAGLTMMPEDAVRPMIARNVIRNIKPTVDPGSTGCYGILVNGRNASIIDNTVEKVVQYYGTDTSATLATGDGTTKVFTGTLASLPVLDTFTVSAGAVTGTANDQGWYRPGKGKVLGTGLGATQATMSWIDYNTGQWRLEFTTAPAAAQAITGNWKVLTSIVGNIEGIYVKASRSTVALNRILDCTGSQGMLALKGGGSQNGIDPDGVEPWNAGGGNSVPQTGPYSGGPNASFGTIAVNNVLHNQIYTGVFGAATGIWLQSDYALISGNWFENISDRAIRSNVPSGVGRVCRIENNIVKDFRGGEVVYIPETWHGFEIDGLTVEGLKPVSGTTVDLVEAALSATEHLYHFRIANVTITGGNDLGGNAVNTATLVNILRTADSAGSSTDVKITGISSRLSWRMEEKVGAGTAGKRVFRDYSVENNAQNATVGSTSPARQLTSGSGVATTTINDDGGHA